MYQRFHYGLALVAKISGIDLGPLTKQWCATYERRLSCRGKQDAVKFVKELNTVGERYALRQNITAIPWTKSDNEGFPNCISKFKPYLRNKDPLKVILALSLLRSCEDLRLPISKDISTITEPCSSDNDLIVDIIGFIPEWVSRLQRVSLPEMKYHFTVKNGPNGHALHTSDTDISAVLNDSKIYEAIRIVQKQLNDVYPMFSKGLDASQGAKHSKLTQFPEKAGKTRTIAVVDYYSQRCLRPLHYGVMNLLRSLVSDGTYSHQNVGKFAQMKTKEKSFIFCADLTAFTDRFPSIIQRELLFNIIEDKQLAQSLWTLLAERTFVVAWSGEKVTYSCGQPMGAYASWPLCSLAHHLVVEYCARQLNIRQPKHLYRMIGDDVIITERALAQKYKEVIQLLGVELNLGKTVISSEASDYSGAEVAKQLYLNGTCLTPLTPGFIRNLRNPYMFNTCMKVLKERYEFFRPELPPVLIDTFFQQKNRREVWLLCSNPINGVIKPGNPGYDEMSPWVSKDLDEVKDNYYTMVTDQLLDKAMAYADKQFDYLTVWPMGSPWKDSTQPPPRCLKFIEIDISKQLTKAMERLGDLAVFEDPESIVAEFDFIPDPSTPYMERKEMRQRRISSVIKSLFDYDDNRTFIKLDW